MAGGVISTGNHPKLLWPGIKKVWGLAYDEHEEEFSKIFTADTSEKSREEDVEVTSFGLAPIKPQGASVQYDTELQGTVTQYVHATIALGYIVTMEELQDNLYEEVSRRRAQALAFAMRQSKENIAANVLNRGFDSAHPGGDGVQLFSDAHPTRDGTQSNILATAADLSEQAVEDMIIQIMQAKNSRGLKISLMPRCLIVSPSDWFNANRIVNSTLQTGTANNDVNVINATNALPEGVVVNHYLTDPDAWFIKTNAPRGLMHFQRSPIEFTQDNDFDTENAKAKCVERYSFGWTDFRGIYGTPGG